MSRLANDVLYSIHLKHIAMRIEHIGKAIRVQHDAVTGLDLCVKRGLGVHRIWQRTENHAAGREQARVGSWLNNHPRRVSGSSEFHGPSATMNSGRRQCEEKPLRANILNHKRVQSTEHLSERRPIPELRDRFRIDTVGEESGADAVAGNIANQQIQVFFFEWSDQPEVATDSVRWLVVSVDTQASPVDGFWGHALLYSCRQYKVLLNLFLMRFEPRVCDA